jgi:hypothetical protein
MRDRAGLAYADGVLADGQVLRLGRLRYRCSTAVGGSRSPGQPDGYADSLPPRGFPAGSVKEAL